MRAPGAPQVRSHDDRRRGTVWGNEAAWTVGIPFHVVVRMQAQAERLAEVLALVQREFSRPPAQGIGRRRGRLFQRLDAPTDLIGIIEWEN
jgi:hypothetical protein